MTTDHTPALAAEGMDLGALDDPGDAQPKLTTQGEQAFAGVKAAAELREMIEEARPALDGLMDCCISALLSGEDKEAKAALKRGDREATYALVSKGRQALDGLIHYADALLSAMQPLPAPSTPELQAQAVLASWQQMGSGTISSCGCSSMTDGFGKLTEFKCPAHAAPPPVAPAPAATPDPAYWFERTSADAAPAAVPARNEPHEPQGVAAAPPGSTFQPPVSTAIPNADEASNAARYLWLRDHSGPENSCFYLATDTKASVPFTAVSIDAAVDAAIFAARGIVSGEAGETRSGSTPQGQEPGSAGTRPEADAASQPLRQPLTEAEIEKRWHDTFSTSNPFCPCDLKSFTKAVRAVEAAHGITTRSPKP